MFLDDVRNPTDIYADGTPLSDIFPDAVDYLGTSWTVVRTSEEALEFVKLWGLPGAISFDHDLGVCSDGYPDTTMLWLRQLVRWLDEEGKEVKSLPVYKVHSANPVGAKNIISFMESWKSSLY